jgi:hypothetical protein
MKIKLELEIDTNDDKEEIESIIEFVEELKELFAQAQNNEFN